MYNGVRAGAKGYARHTTSLVHGVSIVDVVYVVSSRTLHRRYIPGATHSIVSPGLLLTCGRKHPDACGTTDAEPRTPVFECARTDYAI